MNAACVFVAYIKSTATITTPQVQVGRQQQQQQRKGNRKTFSRYVVNLYRSCGIICLKSLVFILDGVSPKKKKTVNDLDGISKWADIFIF